MLYIIWDSENSTVVGDSFELTVDQSLLDVDVRITQNIYPYVITLPDGYNANMHDHSPMIYTLANGIVTATFTYVYKSLSEVQTYITSLFTDYRDNLFLSGFYYGGAHFQSDKDSRDNWTAAVTMIATTATINGITVDQLSALPGYQEWTKYDNTTAYFKRAELVQCGLALGAWSSSVIRLCRLKKNLVLAATTPDDAWKVWTSNVLTDWPNNDFGKTFELTQPN